MEKEWLTELQFYVHLACSTKQENPFLAQRIANNGLDLFVDYLGDIGTGISFSECFAGAALARLRELLN